MDSLLIFIVLGVITGSALKIISILDKIREEGLEASLKQQRGEERKMEEKQEKIFKNNIRKKESEDHARKQFWISVK